MSEEVPIASEGHQEMATQIFEEKFEEMVNLMADARKVEIRLRIYYEVLSHVEMLKVQDYGKYRDSNFKVDRRTFTRILKAIAVEKDNERFQLIREILDPLAHADYIKARTKINTYIAKYDSEASMGEEPYPERRIENVMDENNKKCSYSYLLNSSEDNLIVEEFLVFKHQGYVDYSRSLIDEILSSFKSSNKIGWLYEILSMSRATKRGVKELEG